LGINDYKSGVCSGVGGYFRSCFISGVGSGVGSGFSIGSCRMEKSDFVAVLYRGVGEWKNLRVGTFPNTIPKKTSTTETPPIPLIHVPTPATHLCHHFGCIIFNFNSMKIFLSLTERRSGRPVLYSTGPVYTTINGKRRLLSFGFSGSSVCDVIDQAMRSAYCHIKHSELVKALKWNK